jgi:hypothetical protein
MDQGARSGPRPPPAQYEAVRPDMLMGDLLLFRGKGAISGLIQRGTGSPYSHAGLIGRWNGRVVAFHSSFRGVEVLAASTAVCRYTGRVEWWRLRRELLAEFDEEAFFDSAISLLGTRFAFIGLVRLGWRMLWGRTTGGRDRKLVPSSMFCSQYVSYCFRSAGLDLCPQYEDGATSPADLLASGRFEQVCELYDGSNGQACADLLVKNPSKKRRAPRPGPDRRLVV